MPTIVDLAQPISDRSDPHLIYNSRGGGAALNGVEQVISPLTAVWRWDCIVPVNNAARARSIRVVKSKLMGRFNYLRTRICDRYRITRRDVGAVYDGSSVPYGDGAFHSDGTGFALAQPATSMLVAAARSATSIVVLGSPLAGGMTAGVFFSINDYLYQVEEWETDGVAMNIVFSPPLRAAAEEGDTVDFDAKAIWSLEADDTGHLDLRIGRFGAVQLKLVEALGRSQ